MISVHISNELKNDFLYAKKAVITELNTTVTGAWTSKACKQYWYKFISLLSEYDLIACFSNHMEANIGLLVISLNNVMAHDRIYKIPQMVAFMTW